MGDGWILDEAAEHALAPGVVLSVEVWCGRSRGRLARGAQPSGRLRSGESVKGVQQPQVSGADVLWRATEH